MPTFIHTGDLHDKLGAREAEALSALVAEHPGAVLVDSGDAVGAGNLGFRPGGEPILREMTELGYAAMAMGNRESHVWQSVLETKIRDAGFPVLCANIVSVRPIDRLAPHALVDADGVRVALVGLTVPMVTKAMWTRHVCDLVFENPRDAAHQQSAALRPECDLLVLLSHLGEREDRALAREGLFDVILGGHSHTLTEAPERVGATWLCHTGSYARYAGVWRAEREGAGWLVSGRLEPLRDVR